MFDYEQNLFNQKNWVLNNKNLYLNKMLSGDLKEKEAEELVHNSSFIYNVRSEFTKHSWHIITTEYLSTLEYLTKGFNVLEVCAGGGHTSRLMNQIDGCKWVATDINVGRDNSFGTIWGKNVIKMEASEAIIHFQPDIIFVSWIPYGDKLDLEIASMEVPVIIVGESHKGCTGSEEFFKRYINNISPLYKYNLNLSDVTQWMRVYDQTYIIYPEKLKKLYKRD